MDTQQQTNARIDDQQASLPLFSIVVPTYNRQHSLARALASIRQQTFNNWETIVVDDGSTDGTADYLNALSSEDGRFRAYYQNNGGPASARNLGMAKTRGEIIAFLDSDDIYWPTFLEKHLQAYKTYPNADIVFSDLEAIRGGVRFESFVAQTAVFHHIVAGVRMGTATLLNYKELKTVLLEEVPIKPSAMSMRRSTFEANGGYPELPSAEDWIYFLTLINSCSFVYHNEPLGEVHMSADSVHVVLKEYDHRYMIDFLHTCATNTSDRAEQAAARRGIEGLAKSLYWHHRRKGDRRKACRAALLGWKRTYSIGLLARAIRALTPL